MSQRLRKDAVLRRKILVQEPRENAMVVDERCESLRNLTILRVEETSEYGSDGTAEGPSRCSPRIQGIYVLIEHVSQIGDLKNHSKVEPTLTMAVAFCMVTIDLIECLNQEITV